jgi:hypothetical protein
MFASQVFVFPISVGMVAGAIAIVGAGLAALGVRAWNRVNEYRRAGVRRDGGFPSQAYQPMERYRPMARLLSGEDADFLRGITSCPNVAGRWERSRRRIIRLYLKELASDFRHLHAKARILTAEAPEQYSALVPLLFKQQLTFWRTLARIELRLVLGGWNVPQTSVEELVGAIEAVRREIARVATVSPA